MQKFTIGRFLVILGPLLLLFPKSQSCDSDAIAHKGLQYGVDWTKKLRFNRKVSIREN